MILHNITYNVLPTIEKEWLAWIRHKQLPEIMATKIVFESKILKLLTEIDSDGITYTVQYWFQSAENYTTFQQLYADDFQQKHHSRFVNQYVSFQTLLEEL